MPRFQLGKAESCVAVLHLRVKAQQCRLRPLCVGTEQLFSALCSGDSPHSLLAALLIPTPLCAVASLVSLITCQSGIPTASRPTVLTCLLLNGKLFHPKTLNININIDMRKTS